MSHVRHEPNGRFKLTGPFEDGIYHYGPADRYASIELSDAGRHGYFATIRFMHQEKDVFDSSAEAVLEKAMEWVDAAGELKGYHHNSRSGEPRKYYCVEQNQAGLWQQIGKFATKPAAERFQEVVPGQTRIVHTYPSGHDSEILDLLPPARHRFNGSAEHEDLSAKAWFKRFPDLGREPLFTIRLKLSCGSTTIRAYEGPEIPPYGHTRIFCELKAPGVVFPRGDFYVGLPRGTVIDGDEAKESVMHLFSLKPGDTDSDFFQDYSPEQLEFVEQCGEEIYMIKLERYGEG